MAEYLRDTNVSSKILLLRDNSYIISLMETLIDTVRTEDALRISIPTGEMSNDEVLRLLELVKVQAITSRSQLTQEDADQLATEINKSWWVKNKDRINKMIEENA